MSAKTKQEKTMGKKRTKEGESTVEMGPILPHNHEKKVEKLGPAQPQVDTTSLKLNQFDEEPALKKNQVV